MTEQYQNIITEMNGGHTPEQMNYFKSLCQRVNAGELSMNQAYRKAKMGDFSNFNDEPSENKQGAFVGSFNLWVQNAVENDWVEQGTAAYKEIKEKEVIDTKPRFSTNQKIGFTVALIGVAFIAFAIYRHKNNKQ